MDLETDVLIVGGGLVGGLTACALAHGGVRSIVVDAADPQTILDAGFDGRASALSASTVNAFKALDLWEAIEPHAGTIDDIRVSDQGSMMFLHLDHAETSDEPFGRMVENRVTRQTLIRAMQDNDLITLMAPTRMKTLERSAQGVQAGLADGRTLKAALLIGADGRGSWVRKQAGIKITSWSYGQTALVCTVRHEKPHHNVAQEHFRPGGPFAILPLRDNRASIVWTEKTKLADRLNELDDATYMEELRERFTDFLGAVELDGPRWSWPLGLQFSHQSTETRLALAGDSSHGMHPIAGQGFNMGARDACEIAELVVNASKLGLDLGSGTLLDTYEKRRHYDNHMMLAATDSLTRLFSNSSKTIGLVRNLGMSMVGLSGAAKNVFTSSAMGGGEKLPGIMQ